MDIFVLVVFAVGSLLQLALVTTSPRLPMRIVNRDVSDNVAGVMQRGNDGMEGVLIITIIVGLTFR